MSEVVKIGIIYRDQPPDMFSDHSPESSPWALEFFEESALFSGPFAPRPDFLAVLLSSDTARPEFLSSVRGYFPGAELIGFREEHRSPGEIISPEGLLVVKLPMTFSVVRNLVHQFAHLRESAQDLAKYKGHAQEMDEMLEAFSSAVESAWTVQERKLGIHLLLNKLLSKVGAEECVVYLYKEGEEAPQRFFSTGHIRELNAFEFHANRTIVESVYRNGTPYRNNDYNFEIQSPFEDENQTIRSILCVPLVRRNQKIGVIQLLNKSLPTGFTREDQAFLNLWSGHLTVAIRNIALFEDAEQLTITDDLTKLYNYRYLKQFLESEVKRSLRYKKKVSLLFIDVDGFKKINDTFGHLVGSQALSEMGQVFRKILRDTDIVGRYGGDEFVIVLPDTPLNGAMVIAERIRKKVEDCEFVSQNMGIRLTVSLGVANCPRHTLTAEGLIKKADAAMYRAKELSKNSIKVAV